MKKYVVEFGAPISFYPPLTKDQTSDLYEQYVFRPVRDQAKKLGNELFIQEELQLIGKIIIEASEGAAKTLRQLGFHLLLKRAR